MLSSVIQFVNYMDKKDIKYNNRGPLGDKGREVVEVSFSGKNMNSVRTVFYFDADAEGVAIRVYDISGIKGRCDVSCHQQPQSTLPLC